MYALYYLYIKIVQRSPLQDNGPDMRLQEYFSCIKDVKVFAINIEVIIPQYHECTTTLLLPSKKLSHLFFISILMYNRETTIYQYD